MRQKSQAHIQPKGVQARVWLMLTGPMRTLFYFINPYHQPKKRPISSKFGLCWLGQVSPLFRMVGHGQILFGPRGTLMVKPGSNLTGLKVTLPSSLSKIFERIVSNIYIVGWEFYISRHTVISRNDDQRDQNLVFIYLFMYFSLSKITQFFADHKNVERCKR